MDKDAVRKINLIETLTERASAEGRQVEEPPLSWTEDQIRAHFAASAEGPAEFLAASAEDFQRWFPGLALSRTISFNPKWRVVCFPNAGNAEDMYTSEGTGQRKTPSPLLEWCRANNAECLAVQPPGRNTRLREPYITSCRDMAAALLPVLASKLAETPYIVIAHSVGTWNAVEFLTLARQKGLRMPRHVFLSAMASPDIPKQDRPWRQQRSLSEKEFQEECREWDVNEVVFSAAVWPTYHGLMRADFTLFDEYEFTHAGDQPFDFPMTVFYGTRDRKITRDMVTGWRGFTNGAFECLAIEGHHLWPLLKEPKTAWLQAIVDRLRLL